MTDELKRSAPNGSDDTYDVIIIGAGPTGLFASFYAGMRGMRTLIVDALPEVGGQVAVLYPEKFIYDVPGFPKIIGRDLVKQLVEQAMTFHPEINLDEQNNSGFQGWATLTDNCDGTTTVDAALTRTKGMMGTPEATPNP